jgi:hypothetical protein
MDPDPVGVEPALVHLHELSVGSVLRSMPNPTRKCSCNSIQTVWYESIRGDDAPVGTLEGAKTRLGEMLDSAITLGANQVNGINFDVSNAETLKDEARKQAMVNAKRRAELYATAAGAQLGSVLTISEDVSSGPRPMPLARAAMAGNVPIEAGTRTLTVEVHVTYALR